MSFRRLPVLARLTYPADPDLSNPTRYRFERPLDTIRSFESNIARNHKQHKIIP